MKNNIEKQEAQEKLHAHGRKDILILEYYGWSKPCRVISLITNKESWSEPSNFIRYAKNKSESQIASLEEAKNKLHGPCGEKRQDLDLLEYKGTAKKALFYDKIVGKTFEAIFSNVIKRNTVHPERRKKQIGPKTKEEAQEAFNKANLEFIEILEFHGWSKKCLFKNKQTGNSWTAQANLVYNNKSVGIKDGLKKIIASRQHNGNIISYEEAVKRCILDTKRTDLSLDKENYIGWTKPAKFFDKVVEDFFIQTPERLSRNNSKHPKRIYDNHYVKYMMSDKNLSIKSYLEESEYNPSYTTVINWLRDTKKQEITAEDIDSFIKEFKKNKTSLEIKIQEMFQISHWNKIIPETQLSYKPDFMLSNNIALNIDGLYWHSEKFRKKESHFELRKNFEEKNIRLFQFYSSELEESPEIIKSIVQNALGKSEKKIYARKCTIKELNQAQANIFLKKNHMMGPGNAKHVGLYFKDNNLETRLVCVLSYKIYPRKQICKIERFCSEINTNVVGGFGRLLSYLENLIKTHNIQIKEIHNWVDLRYGTGKHLKNYNFLKSKEVLSWKWTNYKKTFNRLSCRANMDSRKLTEKQYAQEKRYVKIYDAGQRLWIKKLM